MFLLVLCTYANEGMSVSGSVCVCVCVSVFRQHVVYNTGYVVLYNGYLYRILLNNTVWNTIWYGMAVIAGGCEY